MSLTPDMAALGQLLALLESRYALRVLWALRTGRPQTFRMLQDSVGGITPSTLNTRLKELREARLVHHGDEGYGLTSEGADLCRRLRDLPLFAARWAAAAPASAPARNRAAPQMAALRVASVPGARTAVPLRSRRPAVGIIRDSKPLT